MTVIISEAFLFLQDQDLHIFFGLISALKPLVIELEYFNSGVLSGLECH